MKKHQGRGWSAALIVVAVANACGPRAGPADAGRAALVDAGSRIALELRIESLLPDGGAVHEMLGPPPGPLLPVAQELLVTSNLPLHNYRMRILDEVDRALASDDTPDETLTGLRYHIHLLSPLRSGHRYTLLLDAQSGTALDDGHGQALDEQRFDIRIEGERDSAVKRKPVRHKQHQPVGP